MITNATEFIMGTITLVLTKLVQRVMPLLSMVQNKTGKHVLIRMSATVECVQTQYVLK